MFAQINHMAIISPHYSMLGKFYEAVFGLKPSSKTRPAGSITIGDGYTGLNLIPRRDGYRKESIISEWWSMRSRPFSNA